MESVDSIRNLATLPPSKALALPIAASVFTTGFALAVLGAACSMLLSPETQTLSDSPALDFYALTHLVVGFGLLLAGLAGLAGVFRGSDKLLLVGGTLGSMSLAAIVLLQTLSLWALRYFE